jgi:ribosome-associated translation inhibitor RaiA
MRIEVVGDNTISPQARIYAEYRLFAALSQAVDARRVQRARVALRRTKPTRGCDGVSCSVTITLDEADALRIRTVGRHAYAAINRAIERLRTAMLSEFSSGRSIEKAAQ